MTQKRKPTRRTWQTNKTKPKQPWKRYLDTKQLEKPLHSIVYERRNVNFKSRNCFNWYWKYYRRTNLLHLSSICTWETPWNLTLWLSYSLLNIKVEKYHPYYRIYIKSWKLYKGTIRKSEAVICRNDHPFIILSLSGMS